MTLYTLTKNGKPFGRNQTLTRNQVLMTIESARKQAVMNGYEPLGYRGDHHKIVFMLSNGHNYIAEVVNENNN